MSGCEQCLISVNLGCIGNCTGGLAAQFGIHFAANYNVAVTLRRDEFFGQYVMFEQGRIGLDVPAFRRDVCLD